MAKKTAGKATEPSNKKAEVIAMIETGHTIRGFVSILGSEGGEKVTVARY